MSYVLDALRKSEVERQMATGQNSGVLYPVLVAPRRSWPASPAALAGASVAAVAVALAWWGLWVRTPAPSAAAAAPALVAAVPPVPARPVPTSVSKPQAPEVIAPKSSAKPAARKSVATANDTGKAVAAASPNATAVAKLEPVVEQKPRDLPSLNIAGYIHDEQTGSLAMVNDKLVREGDEVSPGLRLEKILGDAAIFNYKGYRFRR